MKLFLRLASALFLALIGLALMGSSVIPASYNLVQNAGTPLTRRSTINCTGALTCSDSGGVTVFNAATTVNYTQSFTTQTSVVLTHNLNTTNVLVQCFDGSSVMIIPNTTTVTDANNVTVTFSIAQTGNCNVNGAGTPGGGGGSITLTPPYINNGTNVFALVSPAQTTIPGAFTFGWVNQGGVTETLVNGAAQWLLSGYGAGPQLTARTANLTASTGYTASACYVAFLNGNAQTDVVLSDGTGFITLGIINALTGFNSSGVSILRWSNATTITTNVFFSDNFNPSGSVCLRIVNAGGNRTYQVGLNAGSAQWMTVLSEAAGTFLTETKWGYGMVYNSNVVSNQTSQVVFTSATQSVP